MTILISVRNTFLQILKYGKKMTKICENLGIPSVGYLKMFTFNIHYALYMYIGVVYIMITKNGRLFIIKDTINSFDSDKSIKCDQISDTMNVHVTINIY